MRERIQNVVLVLFVITTVMMAVFFNSDGFAFEKAGFVGALLMLAFAIIEMIDMMQEHDRNRKNHLK